MGVHPENLAFEHHNKPTMNAVVRRAGVKTNEELGRVTILVFFRTLLGFEI
jgi:hypothetical protein